MTAEIIPFPIKPKFAEGEISPLLERPGLPSLRSLTVFVPIECLRPFSECVDAEDRVNELLELFSGSDA